MKYRKLGNTDLNVSEVSFGAWAIGGSWGSVNDQESLRAMESAIEAGVNFFDTADGYGDGHSERLLAQATRGRADEIAIATKFCRKGDIHDPLNYTMKAVAAYCEDSLKRLTRERIDLYQIHCPPIEILRDGAVFEVLDKLQQDGKIRHYGVSVETVEEGMLCLQYPNVKALQVIFNIFRQKPLKQLFPEASRKGVGILARLPLASGLLTGKFTEQSTFATDDHRQYNRDGQKFNVGETFAGLPFIKGVQLSRDLSWITEGRGTMARAALRWVLDCPYISCVIPGFRNRTQIEDNVASLQVPSFTEEEMNRLADFYHHHVFKHIRGAY